MPALKPTDFSASVTWIGLVPEPRVGIASQAASEMTLGFDGPVGDQHQGRTRASCVRVTAQHPKGTEIANVRQLTIVSEEELAEITADLGLERFDPSWLGATLVIRGIPNFTYVPPSSRLQAPNGTTLVLDMENRPCQLPAREIEAVYPGKGKAFKSVSTNKRGVTAWVERPGTLALGDALRLHVPDQPVWPHLEAARGA